MSEIETLRQIVDQMYYPQGIISKVNGEINGPGFFPGAYGMLTQSDRISDKQIMVLGQDQDNTKGFEQSLRAKRETYSQTWTNLLGLFKEAQIDRSQCFFTNCLMGIRQNATTNTGVSPGYKDAEFRRNCLEFLSFQISLQRPKVILCLGQMSIKMLCEVSGQLDQELKGLGTIIKIDEANKAVNFAVSFDNIPNFTTNVVLLIHPSFRPSNIARRRYKHWLGHEAEKAILFEVIHHKISD
jgi:uracil-DNA glycosylase